MGVGVEDLEGPVVLVDPVSLQAGSLDEYTRSGELVECALCGHVTHSQLARQEPCVDHRMGDEVRKHGPAGGVFPEPGKLLSRLINLSGQIVDQLRT